MSVLSATDRFAFGRNWKRYSSLIDDERIQTAERSLSDMLQVTDLQGKRFLDVGSGSGLFSLAAWRLGAEVVSFDLDSESVACTRSLRDEHADDERWTVTEGSVLDEDYMGSLGTFDVVYSWGVLHHTGKMWDALANVQLPVAEDGQLFIAIYNRQKFLSSYWTAVKRSYVSGALGRTAVLGAHVPYFAAKSLAIRLLSENGVRGMAPVTDWIDWLGGYPFEVASPEQITDYFHARSFALTKLRTVGGGHGCNEFVFRKL